MQVTIKDISDFYSEYPEFIGQILAETRFGMKTVEYADITAYDSEVYSIITSEHKKISCSPKHRFHDGEDWKYAKDFKLGDKILTKDGIEYIKQVSIEDDRRDLYDLQIEDVKEFYANDIVSHNSTITDAITYALFNKPYRKINKPQLINSVNGKNMLVEIEFETGNKKYLVRRGQKPNIFEIYCNDVLVKQKAAAKDDQTYLEKTVLKINYKSFTQIVILGSSTFVPFMQLTAASRRDVIEDLLDIRVFSVMNSLLKDRMTETKQAMSDVKKDIENLQSMISLQESHIQTLTKNTEEQIQNQEEQILNYTGLCTQEQKNVEKLQKNVSQLIEFVSKKNEVENKISECATHSVEYKSRLKAGRKEYEFFQNNDTCPTCSQIIEESLRKIKMQDGKKYLLEQKAALEEIERLQKQLREKHERMIEINEQIQEMNHEISISNSSIGQYQNYIETARNRIHKIRENTEDVNEEKGKLTKMKTKLKKREKRYSDLVYDWDMFDIAQELLKDKGIKTQIIKQYVPIINKLVNKYLQSMNFLVNFQLDENFNETIKSRYRDVFSYESFSEGEKSRIDLSLLLTWRTIARIKNSTNTNLLILDEVFDGPLDIDGGDDFMKLLHELGQENNVFVISHTQSLIDKFPSSITFTKEKNFSRMN